MRKILFLLLFGFSYICSWAQSVNWKTCTVKAVRVATYQNGSKAYESKSSTSITIDKPNYIIRIGNERFYVEGKEVVNSDFIVFQCHKSQDSEKYVIGYHAKVGFILVGKQKDENAPMYKYYFSTNKADVSFTY